MKRLTVIQLCQKLYRSETFFCNKNILISCSYLVRLIYLPCNSRGLIYIYTKTRRSKESFVWNFWRNGPISGEAAIVPTVKIIMTQILCFCIKMQKKSILWNTSQTSAISYNAYVVSVNCNDKSLCFWTIWSTRISYDN